MKVKAIKIGFYGKLRQPRDRFELKPHSDNFIIENREEKSDKKVTKAERVADVEMQFSTVWMEKLSSAKVVDEEPIKEDK